MGHDDGTGPGGSAHDDADVDDGRGAQPLIGGSDPSR